MNTRGSDEFSTAACHWSLGNCSSARRPAQATNGWGSAMIASSLSTGAGCLARTSASHARRRTVGVGIVEQFDQPAIRWLGVA